jgi:cellulose biosynthesis protein BcsQ
MVEKSYFRSTELTKVICLFNHKGGVSKTTTAFNLGWMIARKNKRVMLVDCDPQCNLTGMVLGLENLETADSIQGERDGKPLNIREGLVPAFESRPSPILPVELVSIPSNENLFLLPGNIGLAEFEVTLGIAHELSGSLVTLKNLPGSIRHLLDITAKKNEIDYVIVDMSPSLGAINQNLFSISDYFLIPMSPDYFSNMAINSLSGVIPKWRSWGQAAAQNSVLKSASYPFPDICPKYLGYIVQNYRPRSGAPARAFQVWIDQITNNVRDQLIPALQAAEMMLDDAVYQNAGINPPDAILQMPDFNSLIAKSQEHQTPIFELTAEQLGQGGSVLRQTQNSQTVFETLFSETADKIISATDADRT